MVIGNYIYGNPYICIYKYTLVNVQMHIERHIPHVLGSTSGGRLFFAL